MLRVLRRVVLAISWGLMVVPAAAAEPPSFEDWLAGVKAEAIEKGIRAETVEAAFKDVKLDEKIITADRNQPEVKLTLTTYLAQRVTKARIDRGLAKMAEHREELRAVSEKYGVQPRFIAAIWGMETNFGSFTGGKYVIEALATLAYDPRRSAFFRQQLIEALKILDEGHITVSDMKGSWAGAMGQPQFMPNSFYNFAQDFDGDGRRDIWTTPVDVFASIANYLKSNTWRADQTWGRQVTLPDDFQEKAQKLAPTASSGALKYHLGQMKLAEWNDLGVRRLNGQELPMADFVASLALPDGPGGAAFLTYTNYRAILRYNPSNFYAIAVGQLADALKPGE
jgi:membrane-bound lytic murein transglycosylase B